MKAWLRKRARDRAEQVADQARWLREERSIAVAVLVVTPTGIPLVRDHRKAFWSTELQEHVAYWKLPGGKVVQRELLASVV